MKDVPSGDSLVAIGSTKAEIPPEKTITLSSLIAPRLVKEQGQQKGDASPFLAELLRLEEPAKQQGLGRWTRVVQMVWLGMI
ncbi:ribonuclease TUDOR 2-like isoform X2 [Camellia sinensis]|uniref:ribonuclease TUDOR 2-like isoform X2 n=1 Tax=Camellia sinensis TaxID=4442 RepID=UPI0010364C27|nr:ribonuclease TUDOR 2-like isoform X2 [Camellia sinensis]